MTTRRVYAGAYVVSDNGRSVDVRRVPGLGWIAAAQWDRFLYSDPHFTKRDAVAEAEQMLAAAPEGSKAP